MTKKNENEFSIENLLKTVEDNIKKTEKFINDQTKESEVLAKLFKGYINLDPMRKFKKILTTMKVKKLEFKYTEKQVLNFYKLIMN